MDVKPVEIPGGWLTPEVAAAQRALVERELQDPARVEPFVNFLWALRYLSPAAGTTLLDVGCGCGHYGLLLQAHYPELLYYGTDVSAAMIEQARSLNPQAQFKVCPFADNDFSVFDVVLASQVLELTPDPWAALELLLSRSRQRIILHRLRLTPAASQPLAEGTYCGYVGQNYLWNLGDLERFVAARSDHFTTHVWARGDQATMVVEK